jgi:hypothetical protein
LADEAEQEDDEHDEHEESDQEDHEADAEVEHDDGVSEEEEEMFRGPRTPQDSCKCIFSLLMSVDVISQK